MANSLGEQVVHDKVIDIFGHFPNLVYYIDWWDYMILHGYYFCNEEYKTFPL
jgi:hypothetical protein